MCTLVQTNMSVFKMRMEKETSFHYANKIIFFPMPFHFALIWAKLLTELKMA